jgi:hypothetical protein
MKQSMGLIYSFEFDAETTVKSADPSYVAIPCKVSYKTNREDLKGIFKYVAMVKSNGTTSTTDQLRGKVERKCKKAFVEFLTGMDLGDADASETVDVTYTEVKEQHSNENAAKSAAQRAREILAGRKAATMETEAPATEEESMNMRPDNPNGMSEEQIEAEMQAVADAQQAMNTGE